MGREELTSTANDTMLLMTMTMMSKPTPLEGRLCEFHIPHLSEDGNPFRKVTFFESVFGVDIL